MSKQETSIINKSMNEKKKHGIETNKPRRSLLQKECSFYHSELNTRTGEDMNEEEDTKEEEDIKEEEADADADVAALLDLSKKKKKKKKKKIEGDAPSGKEETTTTATGLSTEAEKAQTAMLMEQDAAQEFHDPNDPKANYTYENLLERVVELLTVNNPDLVEKKRTRIKPPQLQPVGSRKTLWVNFQEICTMMQRDPQHVYSFLMAELGTQGSIDGNQRLVIRGRYLPKYIESLLRKYVIEYVTCEMCRSPNTELKKDQHTRLYFLSCRDCGSTRSVATVRSGYHATSRADRRAARNAKA